MSTPFNQMQGYPMNRNVIHRLFNTDAGIAAVALRIPVGIIFAAHGAQKLFGWFGGHGLYGTGQWMASIGLEPGLLMALLAGSAEFFGGLALIFGVLVRPAAVVLAFTMLVAILAVHVGNGLFMSNGGYEFGLALLAASVSLAITGAGRASVDSLLDQRVRAH
ncbi:putative oxidoreductase [Natronocella acetinitrilica]|uniref:Oxidoreductase n=2 Tax=Natronocella acetinitrilica TaxID=414046 RepID=A0AAE3G547_9GAMM|nr:putative oxidoreductase [Natronocella acetinitrilica]